MREIKFRAWNKQRNAWHDFRNGTFESDDDKPYEFNMYNPFTKEQILDFQQYTGLKDKNGKEIYEGDIVKSYDNLGYKVLAVVWNNGGGRFDLEKPGYYTVMDLPRNLEVIGNIWESPELLTAPKQKES